MNAPDFSRGFLRLPLAIWLEVFCRAPLTRRQLQLVAVVIRESWGWQTPAGQVHLWTRPLSVPQFAQATGLSTDHLRRDLDQLTARGILCRSRDCYRFVADSGLWTMPAHIPLKVRPAAPESPAPTADPALPDLASKKRYRKQRYVDVPSETELSPTGENSSRSSSARLAALAGAQSSAPAVARLVRIIATFVGSLSPSQAEELRRWICEDGIAAVWATLEPALRKGEAAGRSLLAALLAHRSRR